MERIRSRFQGMANIVRFNWHLYLLSICFAIAVLIVSRFSSGELKFFLTLLSLLIILPALISLVVSVYIYDLSDLYSLGWLDKIGLSPAGRFLNINAGFDETSGLLRSKYPESELTSFDFFDLRKHTEISIARAREAYAPCPDAVQVAASHLPVSDNFADAIFVIFAAHEIRNQDDRITFFREVNRTIKPSGKVVVTEHLRDFYNLIAYNIGAFHFLSRSTWNVEFREAGLNVRQEISITPFVTTFVLEKNGTPS